MRTRVMWSVCIITIVFGGGFFNSINNEVLTEPVSDTGIWSNGIWWINASNDTAVQSPMQVFLDGVDKGSTYMLKFGYQYSSSSWPEFAVIYNTGYIRLKPLHPDDLYGTSFILGPGYWESNGNYFHNIQISRIDIDTGQASSAKKIILSVTGQDYGGSHPSNLLLTYSLILPAPTPTAARIQVNESYTVISPFSLSTVRQTAHEAFKWAQFSSMFISLDQSPGDGLGDHDSDGAQFTGKSGKDSLVNFAPGNCDQFIFTATEALNPNRAWVQSRHSDDLGWQGNTPNTIIQLNNSAIASKIVPQGFIQCDTNHDNDNVGLWLNNEAVPTNFTAGMAGTISLTLIAQDDPMVTTIDNSAYEIPYNAWKGGSDNRAYGGGYRYSSIFGQTISYSATKASTTVGLMAYRGPNQGKIQVYIDGKFKETLDLYRSSPQFKFVRTYHNLPNAKHTITLKVLGQKNPNSTGKEIRVDAFKVGTTTVDENHWSVRYGGWYGKTNPRAYLGHYRYSNMKNQSVAFTIYGTTFKWITATGPTYGKAKIYVDGSFFKTVDLYSPTAKWKVSKILSGLTNKKHAVKIVVMCAHNPNSLGNWVAFDGFVDP